MPVCLRSRPSGRASLKFAGYSNLLNGDILKMSNLKLSQLGMCQRLQLLQGYHTLPFYMIRRIPGIEFALMEKNIQ